MQLTVYTDGGSSGNPGPAASAYVIYQDGQLLTKYFKKIGEGTNNLAEYTALVMALEKVKEVSCGNKLNSIEKINIFADSQLMINQVNGFYKVKNAAIREMILKIRILEQQVGVPVVYKHILREKNKLADSLVKQALVTP